MSFSQLDLTFTCLEDQNYRKCESWTPVGVKSHGRVPENTNQLLCGTQNVCLATRFKKPLMMKEHKKRAVSLIDVPLFMIFLQLRVLDKLSQY
jgi:hypothetical protein